MGQLDQLAKDLFAEETAKITAGAAVWDAPVEIGLAAVRLDGVLRVRDADRLAVLAGPWTHTRGHDELVLEIKMPGDHVDLRMLDRAVLRRQARQVQRREDPEDRWDGEEPLWIVAPHVPEVLPARRKLEALGSGCYRVGPCFFPLLWIAANELPFREELIPFLVARSGGALDDFARWVARRPPRDWVMRMVQVLPMSNSAREDILRYVPQTDDPEIRARQRHVARVLLDIDPELRDEVTQEALDEGGLRAAREGLRRVLARRGLTLTAEQEASIQACRELATLERWLEEAVVAPSAADALR